MRGNQPPSYDTWQLSGGCLDATFRVYINISLYIIKYHVRLGN